MYRFFFCSGDDEEAVLPDYCNSDPSAGTRLFTFTHSPTLAPFFEKPQLLDEFSNLLSALSQDTHTSALPCPFDTQESEYRNSGSHADYSDRGEGGPLLSAPISDQPSPIGVGCFTFNTYFRVGFGVKGKGGRSRDNGTSFGGGKVRHMLCLCPEKYSGFLPQTCCTPCRES